MRKDRFMIAPFILATKKYKKLKIGRTYGPAARKAWLGLVNQLDARANVTDVCVGTNKANAEVGANRDVQFEILPGPPAAHRRPTRPGAADVVSHGSNALKKCFEVI
jgi:hypothetical protein